MCLKESGQVKHESDSQRSRRTVEALQAPIRRGVQVHNIINPVMNYSILQYVSGQYITDQYVV